MHKMKILVAVLIVAFSLLAPAAASAADNPAPTQLNPDGSLGTLAASCPSGEFCIWRYTNPGSNVNRYSWSGSDSDYRNNYWDDGATVDNTASAAFNNGHGSYDVNVYRYVGYSDWIFCLAPGWGFPDLRDIGWDNYASSHKWVPHPSC